MTFDEWIGDRIPESERWRYPNINASIYFAQEAWNAALSSRSPEGEWVSVETEGALNLLEREDNCCLEPADVERFSISMLVWDEDDCAHHKASYDFREKEWSDDASGCKLTGVTHFSALLAPPSTPSLEETKR